VTDAARPRLAVVGARRHRQGLGAFLARFAQEQGAEVTSFLGTSDPSVAEAARGLEQLGVTARGYTSLDDLLESERPDGLIIASPHGTHAAFLRRALAERLHVLCEKPLVWGCADPAARAEEFEREFAAAGLVLHENCQWPLTLESFRSLHPGAPALPGRTFEMWMGPTSRGRQMLLDALSHPLSLLQALFPGPDTALADARFSTRDPAAGKLETSFLFRAGEREVRVRVELASTPHQPRPAGYALDGFRAQRRVRMEDYALFFEDGGRRVAVADPMRRLVAGFVASIASADASGEGPHRVGLGRRARWLEQLIAAYDHADG
jgi:predicted dehydrogenase